MPHCPLLVLKRSTITNKITCIDISFNFYFFLKICHVCSKVNIFYIDPDNQSPPTIFALNFTRPFL